MTTTTDDAVEQQCPIPNCNEPLVLTLISCVPLYRHDPPWPGAGRATYDHDDSVSDCWEVECLARHRLWNSLDQIRATNARLTEDDYYISEDAESAPTFELAAFLEAFPSLAPAPVGGEPE